jgi:hypothetical protein
VAGRRKVQQTVLTTTKQIQESVLTVEGKAIRPRNIANPRRNRTYRYRSIYLKLLKENFYLSLKQKTISQKKISRNISRK